MSPLPKVSIIVPVYNVECYLQRCLDSIIVQTYRDFEIILIDDGSQDLSGNICDKYASLYSYIRVYHQANRGVVWARKIGVEHSEGQYISFIDADDWIEEDFLMVLVKTMDDNRADMVISGYWKEENGKTCYEVNKLKAGIYERSNLIEFYKKMLYYGGFFEFGIQPFLWNKLFKRDMLLGCIDVGEHIYEGEDVAIIFPYMLKADKIIVTEKCLYHYIIREGSSSRNRRFNFFENTSRLYLYLNEKFQKSEHYHFLLPQLDAYFRMMVYYENKECFIGTLKNMFPFSDIPKGAKIILYGAGFVGKTYFHQLLLSGYCQIVLWVDELYRKPGYDRLGVVGPENINEHEYDYIVIAIEDKNTVSLVRRSLLKYGVLKEKILPGEEL